MHNFDTAVRVTLSAGCALPILALLFLLSINTKVRADQQPIGTRFAGAALMIGVAAFTFGVFAMIWSY